MKNLVFIISLLLPVSSFSMTGEELGKEMKDRFYAKDEELHFTLVNRHGKSKEPEKEIILRRLSEGKDQYVMGKIIKPMNLKNTGITAHVKDNDPQIWVYLPSSKQVRRIQSTNSGGGSGQILGSELSIEDLQFQNSSSVPLEIKKAQTKAGKKILVVEAKLGKNSKRYSKVVSWVSQDDFTTVKTECYDKKNRLLKIIDFSNYKKIQSVTRPYKIVVRNMQNGKRSELTVAEAKVNLGQKAADFNPQTMAD
jgi:outer membrane lipoprotein-sorting protein